MSCVKNESRAIQLLERCTLTLEIFTRLDVEIIQFSRYESHLRKRFSPKSPAFLLDPPRDLLPVSSFTISYVTYTTHSVDVPLISVNRRPGLRAYVCRLRKIICGPPFAPLACFFSVIRSGDVDVSQTRGDSFHDEPEKKNRGDPIP